MNKNKQINNMLLKNSLSLIKKHKILLLFPLTGSIVSIGIVLLLLAPFQRLENILFAHQPHIYWPAYIAGIVLLNLLFFMLHLSTTLSNAAMTTFTLRYVKNKKSSAWAGVGASIKSIGYLYLWTLFMTTAGIIIRLCETWMSNWYHTHFANHFLKKRRWIIGSLIILPALIEQPSTPLKLLKQSATLIDKTWGHPTHLRIHSGMKIFFLKCSALLPLAAGMLIGEKTGIYISGTISVILFFLISSIQAASLSISCTALYLYAKNERTILTFFDESALKNALYNRGKK